MKGHELNTKILLDENELPKQWYNILPDLPKPLSPPISPATREPVSPDQLTAIFAKECIRQEVSQDRWIDIPEELRDVYRTWRPTPLFRATRLEKSLKTPARIYYKYEGVSPPGSHKPNTAVAQAYYNMKEGVQNLTTETGAGQWGSALAFGCMMFGMKTTIFMVRASYDQKPYRRMMMEAYGGKVYPSPSDRTEFGKKILKEDPSNSGSLGIAISEAVEEAVKNGHTKYSLGSVLNHVLLHQTLIGLEAKKQMQLADDYPDALFGCVGGGSSFSGLYWPFYHDVASRKAPKRIEFMAVESTACPKVTKGYYTYDHFDAARMTPMGKMHTIGHTFVPAPIHAGGLRYHGMAPTLCLLKEEGAVKSKAYNQVEAMEAAVQFARTEGIVPAPEPSHAIKAVVDEALRCKQTGEKKSLLFLLCGHGYFDMQAFSDFFAGKLMPYDYPQEKITESMRGLKRLYPWLDFELNAAR